MSKMALSMAKTLIHGFSWQFMIHHARECDCAFACDLENFPGGLPRLAALNLSTSCVKTIDSSINDQDREEIEQRNDFSSSRQKRSVRIYYHYSSNNRKINQNFVGKKFIPNYNL